MARTLLPWFLLAFALLLTGCGPTPAPPLEAPPNPVSPEAIQAILNWFVAHRNVNWQSGRDESKRFNEHRGFFVVRRAIRLIGYGPASWGTEADYATVINRIDSEFGELNTYTTDRLGQPGHTGPLTGGTGDKTPPHLDLADVAQQKTTDPATTVSQALTSRSNPVQRRTVNYLTQRRARALAIIWRAAGLHNELWQPSGDQHTATLHRDAMDEILDRRLHASERMSYQIAVGGVTGAGRINMSAGPGGPWTDGSRIRMFEYPRLSSWEFTSAGVGPISDEVGQPPANDWKWESALHRRIVWNHGWTRIRSAADPGLPPDPSNMLGSYPYARMLISSPGLTPAGALDALYTAAANLWDRSWMYCDHVVSSLHLTALLLAQRRRTGGDAAFNTIVTSNPPGYVQLTAVVGGSGGHHLMMGEPDPAFQSSQVAPADFQIGDQLIFWNSILYPLVSTGEWRLENALIVDVESAPAAITGHGPADSSPSGGSIKLHKLIMQGHGTEGRTIGRYEELIGNHLRNGMNDARDAATAAGPGATTASHNGDPQRLVKWSPYPDTWRPPGPWWVRVPIGSETAQVVRDRLRKGVIPGPFPNPAPFADSVYFPLWEPQYTNGWDGYLAARAAGPVRVSQRLRPTPVDGTVIPGLHYTGDRWDPLPVVRPKVVV